MTTQDSEQLITGPRRDNRAGNNETADMKEIQMSVSDIAEQLFRANYKNSAYKAIAQRHMKEVDQANKGAPQSERRIKAKNQAYLEIAQMTQLSMGSHTAPTLEDMQIYLKSIEGVEKKQKTQQKTTSPSPIDSGKDKPKGRREAITENNIVAENKYKDFVSNSYFTDMHDKDDDYDALYRTAYEKEQEQNKKRAKDRQLNTDDMQKNARWEAYFQHIQVKTSPSQDIISPKQSGSYPKHPSGLDEPILDSKEFKYELQPDLEKKSTTESKYEPQSQPDPELSIVIDKKERGRRKYLIGGEENAALDRIIEKFLPELERNQKAYSDIYHTELLEAQETFPDQPALAKAHAKKQAFYTLAATGALAYPSASKSTPLQDQESSEISSDQKKHPTPLTRTEFNLALELLKKEKMTALTKRHLRSQESDIYRGISPNGVFEREGLKLYDYKGYGAAREINFLVPGEVKKHPESNEPIRNPYPHSFTNAGINKLGIFGAATSGFLTPELQEAFEALRRQCLAGDVSGATLVTKSVSENYRDMQKAINEIEKILLANIPLRVEQHKAQVREKRLSILQDPSLSVEEKARQVSDLNRWAKSKTREIRKQSEKSAGMQTAFLAWSALFASISNSGRAPHRLFHCFMNNISHPDYSDPKYNFYAPIVNFMVEKFGRVPTALVGTVALGTALFSTGPIKQINDYFSGLMQYSSQVATANIDKDIALSKEEKQKKQEILNIAKKRLAPMILLPVTAAVVLGIPVFGGSSLLGMAGAALKGQGLSALSPLLLYWGTGITVYTSQSLSGFIARKQSDKVKAAELARIERQFKALQELFEESSRLTIQVDKGPKKDSKKLNTDHQPDTLSPLPTVAEEADEERELLTTPAVTAQTPPQPVGQDDKPEAEEQEILLVPDLPISVGSQPTSDVSGSPEIELQTPPPASEPEGDTIPNPPSPARTSSLIQGSSQSFWAQGGKPPAEIDEELGLVQSGGRKLGRSGDEEIV